MVSVDLPISLAIFLIFLVFTIVFVLNYFADMPSLSKVRELRTKAEDLYDSMFKSKGLPENWESSGSVPAMPGVMTYLKKVPVTIEETAGINRTNEPIVVNTTTDEDCTNSTWNNTVRVYDSNMTEVASNITEQSFCSGQFLKNTNVTFNVNISANEKKKFEIYYSDDTGIVASNNTIVYNTNSWNPADGDSWTETTVDWSRYLGSSGTVALDTTNKKLGTSSVNLPGTLDSQGIGLDYNPAASITGVSNGWYVIAWLFVDDKSSLNNINISVSDGTNLITADVSSQIVSNSWYLFERQLSSSSWSNWSSFNAANGIDFVRFVVNGTNGLSRTLKMDGLRFEKSPLVTTVFPEEKINAISYSKTKGMRNTSSDEVVTIGEGYKFRIEIEQK